jgi:hypothetical protein
VGAIDFRGRAAATWTLAVSLGAPILGLQDLRSNQLAERKVHEASGCEAYRADFDMYAVCQKRGLPTRRSSSGGFAYRPMDQEIAAAPLPQECRDASGQPKWNGAPEVIEWVSTATT